MEPVLTNGALAHPPTPPAPGAWRRLRAALAYSYHPAAPDADACTLTDAVYALTLHRARVFSLIVLGVDALLFYLYDYANYAAGRWDDSPFYLYGVVWRGVSVVGLLCYLGLDALLQRRRPVIGWAHRLLATVYVAYIVALGTSQAVLIQLVVSDVSIYALCVLAVATLLHLPHRGTWIIFGLSLGALVGGMRLVGVETEAWVGLTTNAASVVAVALVLERFTYHSLLRNLTDACTIRRKNDQIEAAYALAAHELEEARAVQLALLPPTVPAPPHAEVAARSLPAAQVGGDYYDGRLCPDGTLTLAIGDATGHGVRAGAMVTATKVLLADLLDEPDLAAILHKTSQTLRRVQLPRLYMTLALARLRGDVLELAGAGMPPALVWRAATGAVETVALKGAPLGGPFDFPYATTRLTLGPGDTVALMSDGLPERRDAEGAELGYEALAPLLARSAGGTAEAVATALTEAATAFSGGAPLHDDLTVIVLRRLPLAVAPSDAPHGPAAVAVPA